MPYRYSTTRPLKHELAILALFKRRPMGVTRSEVAEHLGICAENAGFWLRRLRDLGLAAPSKKGGFDARWSTPERVQVLQDAAKEKARKRRAYLRNKQRMQERAMRIKKIVVPASGTTRPFTTAPISVFHLAHA